MRTIAALLIIFAATAIVSEAGILIERIPQIERSSRYRRYIACCQRWSNREGLIIWFAAMSMVLAGIDTVSIARLPVVVQLFGVAMTLVGCVGLWSALNSASPKHPASEASPQEGEKDHD